MRGLKAVRYLVLVLAASVLAVGALVQSEATTVLPSVNGGPWQTAEQLTSGG